MADSGVPATHVVSRIVVVLTLAGLLAWLIGSGLPARFGQWALIEVLDMIRTVWRLNSVP